MKHWTRKDHISLAIHGFYAMLAVALGGIEGYWMWRAVFGGQDAPAIIAVLLLDALCLLGYMLILARTGGPIASFGHGLPLVSFVPLAWGAHSHLASGLPWWAALGIAIGGAVWLGVIDWLCLRHIERICTPPVVVEVAAVNPAVALIEQLRAQVEQAKTIQDAYFELVAAGQQALVAQARSLAVPAPQPTPQVPTELVVIPPDRPADPLWGAKVEAWRMRPLASWDVIAGHFEKSPSTVRGWVAQVEEAING